MDIQLQDGATKLFLSTKGEVADISRSLKNFLDYVDGCEPADELMQEIDRAADVARKREEWRREYMTLALELNKARAEGETRGEARGKIEAVKNMIRAGLTTLTAVQESGLYSEQELVAISMP